MINFSEWTTEQLYESRDAFQAKVDDQENDGRMTASSRMRLDYWMAMVEGLNSEIARRESA